MRRIHWSALKIRLRSPLFWLVVLYVTVGVAYALVTPMLEKPDEEGHYGYIRYLREHHSLPPLYRSEEQMPAEVAGWLVEAKQPPLYYLVATLLSSWLSDIADTDGLLVLNPYMDLSVPGYRNDNRNQYLHPPNLTPVVLASRLVSLAFGLGTVLVAYWFALQLTRYAGSVKDGQQGGLFPDSPVVPIAVAALVGFQPIFLYIATAVNNDAALVFLSTLLFAMLVSRLQRGPWRFFPFVLGALLGLVSLTKVSGLVFFPLVGLALLLVHRGINRALIRDGIIVLVFALLVGGWWYARNALLYGDPLTLGVHISDAAEFRPLLGRLGHDLSGIEHTFWANPARTFVSEIWLDKVSIWWGRVSLILLLLAFLFQWSRIRANWPLMVMLVSWPLTFLLLLLLYWNSRFRWPFGRLLFPSLVPLFLLLVWGCQVALPNRWRRPVMALGIGALMVATILTPLVSVYPLYRPWGIGRADEVQRPMQTLYTDAETGEPIARLVGYNLPELYAVPGTYYPIELCWQPLSVTDVPYAVFVQLLDLSQLDAHGSPGIWGRRETYPGLGNLPTDRWALDEVFCDTLMTWVYPDAPTPLGAAIEVGFLDPESGVRLQPVSPAGEPITLGVVGGTSVLSAETAPRASLEQPTLYVIDDAIALDDAHISGGDAITVTLTWRSLRPVPYDATVFVHFKAADGETLIQVDRQPLDGRYPTSYWLPGQVITEVVSLGAVPEAEEGPLTLGVGLYTWPSLERLPVVDGSGMPQQDNAIILGVPATSR